MRASVQTVIVALRWMLIGAVASWLAPACPAQEPAPVYPALQNPGFETPSITDGAAAGSRPGMWYYFASEEEFTSGITDAKKKSGLQGLRFKAQKTPNTYHGFAQKIRVTPGRHYAFSVYVMLDPSDLIAGGGYGQISLEWKKADGSEISRVHGPAWASDLGTGRWEKFLVEGDAPADAASVAVVIMFYAQSAAGSGSFFVDDAELVSRSAAGAESPPETPRP
jgi:hypothetical protein